MKPRRKAEYIVSTYMYEQKDVVRSLGVRVKASEVVRVYCDGDNLVRIEIWRSDSKEAP